MEAVSVGYNEFQIVIAILNLKLRTLFIGMYTSGVLKCNSANCTKVKNLCNLY